VRGYCVATIAAMLGLMLYRRSEYAIVKAAPKDDAGAERAGGWMRFLYFNLIKDAPDRVRATAPQHAAYWRQLGLMALTEIPHCCSPKFPR
jgi:hypothetical protein